MDAGQAKAEEPLTFAKLTEIVREFETHVKNLPASMKMSKDTLDALRQHFVCFNETDGRRYGFGKVDLPIQGIAIKVDNKLPFRRVQVYNPNDELIQTIEI